ncbi:MAG: hypothetical protein WC822_06540 [Candidatus Paceibacterota bacterium]
MHTAKEARRARNTITGYIRKRYKAGKLDWFVETHTEGTVMVLFKLDERTTKRRLVEVKKDNQEVMGDN